MERVVHEAVELRTAAFFVFSFFHIPDMGNLDAGFGNLVRSGCMNYHVFLASGNPWPVNHIIPAALGSGKLYGGIAEARHVVRMDVLIHIMIHVIICLRAILISEKITKTIRKHKGDNPLIQKLIDSKRMFHPFQTSLLLLCEFVSFHKQNSALLADSASVFISAASVYRGITISPSYPQNVY